MTQQTISSKSVKNARKALRIMFVVTYYVSRFVEFSFIFIGILNMTVLLLGWPEEPLSDLLKIKGIMLILAIAYLIVIAISGKVAATSAYVLGKED